MTFCDATAGGPTCCTPEMEEELSMLSRNNFEDLMEASSRDMRTSFFSKHQKFDGRSDGTTRTQRWDY
ncbi:hypothetical protein NHX12_005685 [Muraenolepis orangiensis]|uniref:Uncharacterized protein n=1 Tax=Muraenolepis orangiensis TaxID=630683 RepID=A0A9Q0ICF1_9TELE|nr:hypothetical protein NHX12_005685 [Muraenolepis orangiensis]